MYYKLCLFTHASILWNLINFTIVQNYLKSTNIEEDIIKTS